MQTDASSLGLGAVIIQDGRPIAYASRSLSKFEYYYSQFEKETLAIVFGCERFHQYLYAKKVMVQTDHKPVISCFKKPIHECPMRIQRMLLRLLRYDIDVVFTPGKNMYISDMLSRAYIDNDMTESQQTLEADSKLMICNVIRHMKCSDEAKYKIISATNDDKVLVQVAEYIQNGWPVNYSKFHLDARVYWSERANLSIHEGLILFNDRIVIPTVLRAGMLQHIHQGHQGQDRCKMLARIKSDIEKVVSSCVQCLARRKMPAHEPMVMH